MTTVLQTITDAMVDAGLLMEGATPSTDQQAKYLRRLNDIVQLAQTRGLKLWLERDFSTTLVQGTASYTLTSAGTQIVRVTQDGYRLSAANEKTPVRIISREEYTRLSNTTQEGSITQVFVEKLVTSTKVYCWNVPDAQAALGTLHLIGQVRVSNYALTSDDLTTSFPQEWAIYLRWALADEICTGQPESIMQRCATKAAMFLNVLEDWDVEDASTKFESSANSQSYSRFV